MSPEAMRLLRTVVDVWLPDFKFGNDRCAVRLSRTPWYFDTVAKNHKLIHGWSEDFVIRHLIMPNHVDCCTKPVLDWIGENMPDVPVNIMDQYHPDCFVDPSAPGYDSKYSDISRIPGRKEILEAYSYALSLGLNFEALSYEKNMTGLRA
jgi:putative pyruvate formate lyase activating enzyme